MILFFISSPPWLKERKNKKNSAVPSAEVVRNSKHERHQQKNNKPATKNRLFLPYHNFPSSL